VVDHFARAGRDCFFLQWDKSDAYRSIPIREQDQHLTGFFVPELGFGYSPTIPFGFASSAYLWKRFMDMFLLALSLRIKIPVADIHYWVDDCLLILSPCASSAVDVFGELCRTARRYNFHLHPTKIYLARSVTYLGVTLDSVAGTLSIPPPKLEQVRTRIQEALLAPRWSRTLVQRLLGSLFNVARCLPPARAFLGRLMAVLRTSHNRSRFVPDQWARAELEAWSHILESWSGTSLARVRAPSSPPALSFHVDAFGGNSSGSFAGVGIFCLSNGSFAYAPFTQTQLALAHVVDTYSTLILEFSVFVSLLASFRGLVAGQVIEVFCDNEGAVAVAHKGYHASPVMSSLCRVLAALLVDCDCFIHFTHIDSQVNLADQLSRGSLPAFRKAVSAQGLSLAPSPAPLYSPPPSLCTRLQCDFFSQE
jgi:hypothetical protein